MIQKMTGPFAQLFATSPEIERQPFIKRPRTMAAIWGGMLACKVGTMALISPELGAALFALTLGTGIVATYARFGSSRDASLSGASFASTAA